MFIDEKARAMPTIWELYTKGVFSLHISAFRYSLPDLHKSALPLKSC